MFMHPYLEKYKLLFKKPKEFFPTVQEEVDYWTVLKFYVIFGISGGIISLLFTLPLISKFPGVSIVSNLISTITAPFIVPFIVAFIIHISVLIFGGRQGYFNTFKPITYATAIGVIYSVVGAVISGIGYLVSPIGNITDITSLAQIQQPMVIAILAGLVGLASMIHMLIASVMGVMFYQKMTKVRAILAVVVIPTGISVLIIILFGIALGGLIGGFA